MILLLLFSEEEIDETADNTLIKDEAFTDSIWAERVDRNSHIFTKANEESTSSTHSASTDTLSKQSFSDTADKPLMKDELFNDSVWAKQPVSIESKSNVFTKPNQESTLLNHSGSTDTLRQQSLSAPDKHSTHSRVNKGKRAYQCVECEKVFQQKSNLNVTS